MVLSVTALGLSIAAFLNSDETSAGDHETGSPVEQEFDKIKDLDHVESGFIPFFYLSELRLLGFGTIFLKPGKDFRNRCIDSSSINDKIFKNYRG